jgi:uncharacterized membrane protein/glutaredoxin
MQQNIVGYILAHCQIPFTQKYFQSNAGSFLQAQTVRNLSEAFDTYRISNMAVKVPVNQLEQVIFPCIAHCQTHEKGANFVVLENVKEGKVTYFDGEQTQQKPLEEFATQWTGHVLLLAPDAQSGEPNYAENRRQEQRATVEKWLAWAGVVGLVVATIRGSTTNEFLINALLGSLYALGAWVSVLLLQTEYGQVSALANKICGLSVSSQSKATGCQTVTHAAGSKLWGVSWAEMGVLYFGGGLVALGVGGAGQALAYLHLLTLLYVPFSLYYQAFVARAWCVLCLVVQGINVAVAVVFYVLGFYGQGVSITEIGPLIGAFGAVAAGWFWFKPVWQAQRELKHISLLREQQQNDSELFLSHLYGSLSVAISPLPHEEQIGNTDAPVVVTMVSNPHCNPCKEAYKELTEWQRYFEDEMQLRIRHINSGEEQYATHEAWAQEVGIEYTPTIFINGHRLRAPYGVTDVWRHVRALAEQN